MFLDPPFDAGLFQPALAAAARIVAPQGYVYLEAPEAFTGTETLTLQRHARAGAVHFHLLQRNAP